MLTVIENEYRVYHRKGVLSAAKHPVAVDEEHRRFCFLTCDRFGLVPPKAMAVPTVKEEEQVEAKTVNIAPAGGVGEGGGESAEGESKEGESKEGENKQGESKEGDSNDSGENKNGDDKEDESNEEKKSDGDEELHFHEVSIIFF